MINHVARDMSEGECGLKPAMKGARIKLISFKAGQVTLIDASIGDEETGTKGGRAKGVDRLLVRVARKQTRAI